MNFGDNALNRVTIFKAAAMAMVAGLLPSALSAQEAAAAAPAAAPAATAAVTAPAAAAAAPVADAVAKVADAASGYVPMAPTPGKGMPVSGAFGFQDQYSPIGDYALWMHDAVLMPIITIITLFVLGLLLWVIVRYNRKRNKVPSKTSHNTFIEVVWTLVPVLILVGVAVPSIDLLAKQYKSPPEDALTVKVTGYQWYWGYTYPDNGGFEVISKMLNIPGEPEVNPGLRLVGSQPSDGPSHLEVDNRMVLPAGVPIRLQVTGSDVIHAFSVPALWFKIDAVPGRLNERTLFIKEPGVYYGQCSELCGVKHGFMPIAVEALPLDKFNAWVRANGGTVGGEEAPAAAAPAPAAPAAGTAPAAPAAPAGAAPAAAPAKEAAPAA